jgi:zinc protease
LNQPYGDIWLKIRPMAYKKHPYRWPTIGKEISHIENASIQDVKDFFFKYYRPNNAVLVVAGNVTNNRALELANKWFGQIESSKLNEGPLPAEPKQTEKRFEEYEAEVPLNMIMKVFHMPARTSSKYHAADLLSDILGRGKSSRLYQNLVKGKKVFNDLSAYVTGSADPGLLVIAGKLNSGNTLEDGESEIDNIIDHLRTNGIKESEMEKVKNKAESSLLFNEVEVLNKAMSLAFSKFLGDASLANKEIDKVRAVSATQVQEMAEEILVDENSSVLYYKSGK